jgi:hypothetical protein
MPTMRRRRFTPLLTMTAIVASSCTGNSAAVVPPECPQDDFLATVQQYVTGSAFIDTPWEPAPDTDLAAALDAGGVACSYGIQEAEVGATVLWVPSAAAFESRRAVWEADGQERVDVPGSREAWALRESVGTERHLWALNLLVDGAWIQINATFLSDLDEAQPLVDAAIAVLSD